MIEDEIYDVVIIGSGIAGAIVAKELGAANKRVLLLEAGEAIPNGRAEMVERFYLDNKKYPESPYPPNPNAPSASIRDLVIEKDDTKKYLDQRGQETRFGSTYERRAGGTMWHWMGTCLRFLPNDFKLRALYGRGVDWPISYYELGLKERRANKDSYYDLAEREIGVSASVADQAYADDAAPFRDTYEFPNPPIPLSMVDRYFAKGVKDFTFDGRPVKVVPTPAGRNSRPYDERRVCAGNTNCVPICPIQAKYDPTVTLHKAFNTGNVTGLFQHVATKLLISPSGKQIEGVEYVKYADRRRLSRSGSGVVRGRRYVVAAHGIETPKLLLLSGFRNPHIGQNLMDHPFYLRWGLAAEPVYPYRGPLSTAGLDTLRDGAFRRDRAAFRLEIGNDGWALGPGDPSATLFDFIDGTDESGMNPNKERLFGAALVTQLNKIYTRQCRIGFEFEQLPNPDNRVTLSELRDGLGIPRPKVMFSYTDYDKKGQEAARRFTTELFRRTRIEDKSEKKGFVMGAGHIMGTYRMGDSAESSVVDKEQRSWEFENLFLLGSGVFPTGGTANPSLTIAALAFWAADTIKSDLGSS